MPMSNLREFVLRLTFRNLSLRTKLSIAALIISLLPMIAMNAFANRATHAALVDLANESLAGAAAQTAANVDGFIQANLDAVRTESQLPDFGEFLEWSSNRRPLDAVAGHNFAKVPNILRALSRRDQVYIESYSLLDANGRDVMDTQTSDIGNDQSQFDYFTVPLKTNLPHVSTIQIPLKGSEASLYFSAPVRNAQEKNVGVLVIRYDISVLQQFIDDVRGLGGKDSIAILLDENHMRIADGSDPNLALKTLVPLQAERLAKLQAERRLPRGPADQLATNLPAFEQALTNVATQPSFRAQVKPSSDTSIEAVVVKSMTTQPWLVAFAQPEAVFLAPVNAQGRQSMAIGLIVILLIFIGVAVGTQVLTSPILRLIAVAEKISAGNLDVQAQVEGMDETGALAMTFNTMTSQLRKTMNEVKERNTTLSRLNENLIAAQARLQYLLGVSPTVIYSFEPHEDFRTTFVSENVETQLGYKSSEFIKNSKYWESLVHPADVEQARQLDALFEQGTAMTEYRFLHKDGFYHWMRDDMRLIRDEAGIPLDVVGSWIDITERKHAEAALAASKERYQSLVENMYDFVVEFDSQMRIIYLSPNHKRLFNIEKNEYVGRSMFEFIHPDDVAQAMTAIAFGRISGHGNATYRLKDNKGEWRWFEANGNKYGSADGTTHIIVVSRDITERKATELALQQTNEKYRSLIESMDNVVCILTLEGDCVYVNEYGARRFGVPMEQIIGRNVLELFPGSIAKHQLENLKLVIANDQGIVSEAETLFHGNQSWIRMSLQPIHGVDGKPFQVMANVINITHLKQAQETLEEMNRTLEQRVVERTHELEAANRTLSESEEKFRLIAETIDEVFWMAELESAHVIYISPAYLQIWGQTEPNFYTDPYLFIRATHPDDYEHVIAALSRWTTCQAFSYESRILRPDGTIRWIWNHGFPVQRQSSQATLYVGAVRDITARKQAELGLEQSLREKEALLKEVHHRVKNNLQVISSMLNLQMGTTTNPEIFQIVQNSQSRIDSIALIHEKLYRSTNLSQVDMRDYLDELITGLYSMFRPEGRVHLVKDLAEVYFGIDTAIPLGLLVNELMCNSFKYAFRDAAIQDRRIHLALQVKPQGEYVLIVGDNGIGLPTGLDYRNTTSLGLQLVMTLVKQLDGTIELSTGQGTEYRITFREVKYKPR